MEKRHLLQISLFLFFLLPISGFGFFSDPNGPVVNNGKIIDLDRRDELKIFGGGENGCDPKVNVRVQLANLMHFEGDLYILPGDARIFLGYEIGATTGVQELFYFKKINEDDPVYYTTVTITLNSGIEIAQACMNNEMLDVELELLDMYGQPYQMLPNAGLGGIFDCSYFPSKTGCVCNDPIDCIPGELNPLWLGSADPWSYCDHCFPEPGEGGGGSLGMVGTSSEILIAPNPCTSSTRLELDIQESENLEVIIYDATGKVLTSWEEYAYQGHYSKEIDTSQWRSGIYFCIAKSGDETSQIRFVKTE